jgi:hypothetical protein
MGKASKRKRLSVTPKVRSAVAMAAEIVRSPAVLKTFLSYELLRSDADTENGFGAMATVAGMARDVKLKHGLANMPDSARAQSQRLLDVSVEGWAEGLFGAFQNRAFMGLIEASIRVAHKWFWKGDPIEALMFDGNPRLHADDPIALGASRAFRRLVADPQDPRWLTLALFCLARAIAVNTKGNYHADAWTDATLVWFDLEKTFLGGDGPSFAQQICELDRDMFDGRLPEIIGTKMLHGMAEASINAYDKAFFK